MPTTTYNSPGWHSFNVPKGVKSVTVTVRGAGGGGANGGKGGRVTGKLAVNGDQTLRCFVGQGGAQGTGTRLGGGGAAGDGHFEPNGYSGGGASYIRLNTTTGTIKAVAGGGGGQSGDNGDGGDGGANIGESGARGTAGPNSTSNATGGTQAQGGNGGTSSSGAQFNGGSPSNGALVTGGRGGEANAGVRCHGGGGGGGGWRAGGGGQAASSGYAPGGGGGGGSNYTGGLTGATTARGAGAGTGSNGSIVITWDSPAPANQPPTPPTDVKIDGKDAAAQVVTKSMGSVTITGRPNDPDLGDRVRMIAHYSTSSSFSTKQIVATTLGGRGDKRTIVLTGLTQNTLYHVRLYSRDNHGEVSNNYTAFSFWTNRNSTPQLNSPSENQSLSSLETVTFKWDHIDPDDEKDDMRGFRLSFRRLDLDGEPRDWVTIDRPTTSSPCGVPDPVNRHCWTVDPGTFKGNTFYEWKVQTRDQQGRWGTWSEVRSFYVTSTSTPPRLISPSGNEAVIVTEDQTFRWRFVDPDPGDEQNRADIRYRVAGTDDWFTIFGYSGDGETSGGGGGFGEGGFGEGEFGEGEGSGITSVIGIPGSDPFWTIQKNTFIPGYRYEWQVRTYDTFGGEQSDWSTSAYFWAIGTPGSGLDNTPVGETVAQGSLGCGTYRIFVFAQGGTVPIGEIEPVEAMRFTRVRDDISHAIIRTNGFGADCCELLGSLRSWMHEIVLFRDGVRVWEGPITRLTYSPTEVEIEAKDCMAYLYRRIMRQGYNDSYRILNGQQVGLTTSVRRAQRIILNALAPHDPNLIPYLTTIEYEDDARQSRVVHDYAKTAWEEVDDLAATAGIDYTTVGRRIILWDTHRAIGRLPEMRDGDFSNPPVVTEYGMQLANYYAVTNGSGVWGAAQKKFGKFYGPVELLASAYGESSGGTEEVLTREAREQLVSALETQAERNIEGRWPTPLIVRVPDNSTLSPSVGVGFDQLIPGVHIPVRATGTCRDVAQWQKLDSVTVEVDSAGERVNVVMSPAPFGSDDPDGEGLEEED